MAANDFKNSGNATPRSSPGTAGNDFIAKMEARRLAQPTIKIIDMRGRVATKCREFPYNGITHFLDERCIDLFQEAISDYNGHYTQGVYERVTNADHTFRAQDSKVRQQQENTSKVATTKSSAKQNEENADEPSFNIIQFSYRPQRTESRMNYVSSVQITWSDESRNEGRTLDLSLLGVRLQLATDIPVKIGEGLSVVFDEMEKKTRAQFGPIAYTVVGIDKEDDRQIVRIKRQMRATEREFDRFVPYFIQTMAIRYKVELKDLLPAVYARVYEHLYARVVQYLHAYYVLSDNNVEFLFAAGNIDHSYMETPPLSSWVAKQLPILMPTEQWQTMNEMAMPAMQRVLALRLGSRLFAIPTGVLAQGNRVQEWMALCKAATESAAFALVCRKQPKLDDGLRDQSLCMLPDSLEKTAQLWAERVSRCTHSCALIPVQSELLCLPEKADDNLTIPTWLNAYEIQTKTAPAVAGMGLRGSRSQERYLYKTRVSLKLDDFHLYGELIDFSINGLRIKLDYAGSFRARDVVQVSFPLLMEKLKEPEDLENQAYRVVRSMQDGTLIFLERDFRVPAHKSARFFAQVIQNNLHKLQPCPAEQLATTEATLTEQMLAFGLCSIPLYFGRDQEKRASILAIGHLMKNSLLDDLTSDEQLALQAMNDREILVPLLSESTNNVGYVDKVKRMEMLYIRNPKTGAERWQVIDHKTPRELRLKLLRELLPTGMLKVFALNVMPQPPIERSQLEHELDPVMRNSRYKADVFRSELNRLVGVGEMFDITPGLQQEMALLNAPQNDSTR